MTEQQIKNGVVLIQTIKKLEMEIENLAFILKDHNQCKDNSTYHTNIIKINQYEFRKLDLDIFRPALKQLRLELESAKVQLQEL